MRRIEIPSPSTQRRRWDVQMLSLRIAFERILGEPVRLELPRHNPFFEPLNPTTRYFYRRQPRQFRIIGRVIIWPRWVKALSIYFDDSQINCHVFDQRLEEYLSDNISAIAGELGMNSVSLHIKC